MLKKLKSLFFVSEKKPESKQPVEAKIEKRKEETAKSSVKAKPSTQKPSGSTEPSKQRQKFEQILLRAIDENNLEGFDYLEFRKTIRSLESITPSEMDRFKSAITMVDSVGSSKKGILDSAAHYLKVLEGEKAGFSDALERQKSKTVEVKKQEIKHTKKLITDKQKQIAKLQKEISSHEISLQEMKSAISSADNNIQTMSHGFDEAYGIIVEEIKRDISIIKSI